MDQIINTVATTICIGFFIGVIVVAAVFGTRSRMRFTKYVQSMNNDELGGFSRKNFSFVLTFLTGEAIGVLGILVSLVLKQEHLIKYFFIGLFTYMIVMGVLGQLLVYRVPRNRK